MISGVFLINQRGDIVISRIYRYEWTLAVDEPSYLRRSDDVSRSAATAFRLKVLHQLKQKKSVLQLHQVIAAKEAGQQAPVKDIDGSTFLYTRHKNMFFVAVTRRNANPGQFVRQILLRWLTESICRSCFPVLVCYGGNLQGILRAEVRRGLN